MEDLPVQVERGSSRREPAQGSRRRMVIELVLAALVASVLLLVAGGLGVVAFIAVPILLLGLLSMALERLVDRRRRRRNVPASFRRT